MMKRSIYTERKMIDFALEGNNLLSKQARLLAESLELNPDDSSSELLLRPSTQTLKQVIGFWV